MPRTLDNTVDWDENEGTIFVKPDELAEAAGCTSSWVLNAARDDYLAKGMPLAQWVVQDRYGYQVGFDVPKSVWRKLNRDSKVDA